MKLIQYTKQIFLKIFPYFLIIIITLIVLIFTPLLDEEVKINDMSYLVDKKKKSNNVHVNGNETPDSNHIFQYLILIFVSVFSVCLLSLCIKETTSIQIEPEKKNSKEIV